MSAAVAMHADWIDGMKRTPAIDVAAALGLDVQPGRGAHGGTFACAACGAKQRHESRRDRRLACGTRKSTPAGWHCHECQASGDGIHLAALALCGRRYDELGEDGRREVRSWCLDFLQMPEQRARPRLEIVRAEARTPVYPPAVEVAALWRAAGSVAADPRVAAWLKDARGLAPEAIAAADLARALPRDHQSPAWARMSEDGKPWGETSYRVLFPLFDACGEMRSLLARTTWADARRKSAAAYGFERTGLVLADRAGVAMLRGLVDVTFEGERVVVIAEGEMNFSAWCTRAEHAPGARVATLGIFSGSWTPAIAARLPHGARVVVATDPDAAGDRYAETILETLVGRSDLRVGRWR